jgi:hypothetical protein
MTLRLVVICSVLALPLLGLIEAQAQSFVTQEPAATEAASPQTAPMPPTASNLPDACKLLTQADMEARFPGRPINRAAMALSRASQAPQYNEYCAYMVMLPSPTSKLCQPRLAWMRIVKWGGQTDGRDGSVAAFAKIRSVQEKTASVEANMRIETLQGVGDEAFQEVFDGMVAIRARKADLIFSLTLDAYSPQTLPNAVALAGQAAKRWALGGMIEAATSIARVDIPEDTRTTTAAPEPQNFLDRDLGC